jgi:hypothetical protein
MAKKKYGGHPNARQFKLRNKLGTMIINTCHFPLCCNFFTADTTSRVYCKNHKRIPDSIKAFTVMKDVKIIGYFEVATKTTVRRLTRKERDNLGY